MFVISNTVDLSTPVFFKVSLRSSYVLKGYNYNFFIFISPFHNLNKITHICFFKALIFEILKRKKCFLFKMVKIKNTCKLVFYKINYYQIYSFTNLYDYLRVAIFWNVVIYLSLKLYVFLLGKRL
ncbi:hypothetical protein H311_02432 [Anncaliia algerae PRA109]|nr:hypothetical protein H311_02432 [Anncaliia algerae PRA109]